MDKKFVAAWKTWRKRNRNGWVYQLLVLFKIIKSPTLEMELVRKEYEVAWAAHSMLREARERSEE